MEFFKSSPSPSEKTFANIFFDQFGENDVKITDVRMFDRLQSTKLPLNMLLIRKILTFDRWSDRHENITKQCPKIILYISSVYLAFILSLSFHPSFHYMFNAKQNIFNLNC